MPFGTGKATLEMTGEHNRRIIFQLLRRYGQLSRQQLSDTTTLHRSTLSKIMSEFLDRRLVEVVGKIEPAVKRVGKKQILLRIRDEVGWALGIGLNWEWVTLLLMSARGRVLGQHRFQLGRDLTKLPAMARAEFDRWSKTIPTPAGKALGVGVGVSGIVDSCKGLLVYSEFFQQRNVPLAHQIGQAFGWPGYADNDVRLEATAHLNQPHDLAAGSFIFIHANHRPVEGGYTIWGFGSSLVLNGRVYPGAHHAAGEMWGPLLPPETGVLTEDDLARLNTVDAPMTDSLRGAADAIAPYIAAVAGYIDPHRIVIGGALNWRNQALLNYLQDRINTLILPALTERRLELQPAVFPGQSTAYGAALLALDEVPMSDLNGVA